MATTKVHSSSQFSKDAYPSAEALRQIHQKSMHHVNALIPVRHIHITTAPFMHLHVMLCHSAFLCSMRCSIKAFACA
eukprot:213604-Chlamydomonas_euryale.AAC.18